jgi:hypothetical protein
LAGPKREAWFSAETFVALSRAAKPVKNNEFIPEFSCWGEEQFSTVLRKLQTNLVSRGAIERRPDIVCFLPEESVEAIDAILELKLLLNGEDPASSVKELKRQMQNARQISSKAKVLGLVFLAAAPLQTPATFEGNVAGVRCEVERALPEREGFTWISGHNFAPVFRNVHTDFHYPSMVVSLVLAVRELSF